MKLLSIPDTIKRGVGRKIVGFFLLAGILPVTVTASLAWFEVNRGMEAEVAKTLRSSAKDYALDMLDRMQRVSTKADQITQTIRRGGPDSIGEHPYLLDDFEAIWTINPVGQAEPLYGTIDPRISADAGGPSLLLVPGDGVTQVALTRAYADESGMPGIMIFQANAQKIWNIGGELPYQTHFCVFSSVGQPYYCTRNFDDGLFEAVAQRPADASTRPARFDQSGAEYLGSSWQLFMVGEFEAPALNVVSLQPTVFALQSSADFRRVFTPALLLVIILVSILSFSMIGNSLVPLHRLSSAVRQITSGNLDTRLRIRSNDEFEALGESFNKMAEQLGRQFSTLEAMSEIDRMILSGAKFEEVSEKVINHMIELTGYEAAAVIARDTDTPQYAKMISVFDGEYVHERIALPMELGHQWCQPRQVTLEQSNDDDAPYRERFLGNGLKYAALIPVVLEDDLKGLLVLSSANRFNLENIALRTSIDLAGRFAVALSSAEREDALYRQAHYDELTGLPNRQLLKDRLEQQIVQARRDGFAGALLFLDLDRFKEINDVYGHSVGDVVLVQAAERILGEVRDSDTVARLGGDEFVVVLPRIDSGARVRAMAGRLLERLTESFSVRDTDHFVGASIGVVMFPDDGDSVETLLKNADAAMYRAKEAGRARFEFFSKELNAESRRKIGLERDLRAAFYNHELELHYQPQFSLDTGIISGAEALLRWPHAKEGFIPPNEFIPLAEDSGLIVDIGRWVIRRTCRDLRRILNKGLHPGAVSVNVSALQLRDPAFASDVIASLQRYDIHPGYLLLEVTETTVAQNRDTVIGILDTLREQGVRVAIDDFGTGYSSLSYLQQMPFDVIKIDKTFVDRIDAGDSTDNICRTIIKMARELGKESIAEGAEKAEQVEFLKANGCDHVQGFFYSKALNPEAFLDFIAKQDFHTQRRKALEIVQT